MRRLVTALVLLLGLGTAGPVQAQTAPSAEQAIHPAVGRYRGHDQQDRLITFTYTRAHGIRHFRINHHRVGHAVVTGGEWTRTCHQGYCSWGAWVSNTHVTGYWQRSGGSASRHGTWRGEQPPVTFQVWHSIT
jgi:hypothetical protein